MFVSNFVHAPENNWHTLDSNQQKLLKEVLIELLKNNNKPKLNNPICQLIADLAITIQSEPNDNKKNVNKENCEWKALEETFQTSFEPEDPVLLERVLRIFTNIFEHNGSKFSTYKAKLLPVLEKMLSHEDIELKVIAMKALCGFLLAKEFKTAKDFIELIELVLSNTATLTFGTPEKPHLVR